MMTSTTLYMRALLARAETGGLFDPYFSGRYDPTGLVKGWAVARAFTLAISPMLDDGRLRSAAINAGGDMLVSTVEADSPGWMIGVEDPRDTRRYLAAFRLRGGAVATSGASKRGEHVARRCREVLQATVIADSIIDADVWATALLAAPIADIPGLTERHGLHALIVTTNGRTLSYDRDECIPLTPSTRTNNHGHSRPYHSRDGRETA